MPFAQTAGLVCGAVFLLLAVYLVASFFGSRRTVPDRYLPRMHDPDPAVRLRALQMLRAVFRVSDSGRQERMVQAFREACRDPNQKVSREARDTLMYFGQVLGRPDLALPERAAQPQPTPPEPAPVLAEGTAPPSPPDGPPAPSPATPLVPEEPRTLTLPVHTDPASLRVRVFISSTFRDMQGERDVLVKRVFPELRQRCRARGVDLVEVDLRWGVTEEQTERGEVLSICLAEIDHCHPFFIGLLGERYGWVPEQVEPELESEQPSPAEHRERSVTELEILYGVLERPGRVRGAFFYFRDPAYLDQVSAACRPDFEAENATAQARLAALKERIRAAGLPVVENYPDPDWVGKRILEDLWAAIAEAYPARAEPDPLLRVAAEQEWFARSHAKAYIDRPAECDRLSSHAGGDGPPLVVLGEPGVGKSALLANWAITYRQTHPGEPMVLHFIGSTPQSTGWAAMLRRIMGELQRCFSIAGDIPDEPAALRADFANWLYRAGQRGRCVLVLDGLNQLEDRDGALDVTWLPPVIPSQIRLVVATGPGRPQEELARRGWPQLRLEPLAPSERGPLIVAYFDEYRKTLAPARVDRIAAAPAAANPRYLRALLAELRVFGIHERLDERIGHYLAAGTIDALYAKILERYEQDYERDRPGLVRDAMSLLWAAHRGVRESELLELLGERDRPLPHALWSPLYLAAEEALVNQSDLLGLRHGHLRTAVRARYLPDERALRAAHLRLADYFAARSLDERQIEELPWQIASAQSWRRLYDLLSSPQFFAAAWKADGFAVKAFWAQVEANSAWRMVDGYRQVLDRPDDCDPDLVWALGQLFTDTGHPAEAASLRAQAVLQARQMGDRPRLIKALINQAHGLWKTGQESRALATLDELETVCRAVDDRDGLQQTLGLRALIHQAHDRLDEALALLKEQAALCRASGDKAGLSASLGNQGVNYQKRNRPNEALALHAEEEALSRELGDLDGLEACLGNQALALRALSDLEGALARLTEQEEICRKLGKKQGLHRALGNRAVILRAQGKSQEALALHQEKARLCRELGETEGLAIALANQARILALDFNQPDQALALAEEAYRLATEVGYEGLAGQVGAIVAELRQASRSFRA